MKRGPDLRGMAQRTVTCRGIPLLGLPVDCGAGKSREEEKSYYVSIHQLSLQLSKLFATPRVSVQKKIQDLGIASLKCSRAQLETFRKCGVVEGFRATIVELRDAERLCDALQRSREKRGLAKKHVLKPRAKPKAKGRKEDDSSADKRRIKKKREEDWLLKRNARMSSDQEKKRKAGIVDGCASIRTASTPTPDSDAVTVQIRTTTSSCF